MKTKNIILAVFCLLAIYGCKSSCDKPDEKILSTPIIYPDYSGTIFPANITAPNFVIKEEGDRYQTDIGYDDKIKISIVKNTSKVIIPLKKWKSLLVEAKGKKIFFRITIFRNKKWFQYKEIENEISSDNIDELLVYRLLYPGYELWNEMGIYQRYLSDYKESVILENKSVNGECMNCHTFCRNSPETMMLHIRGKHGGTIIYNNHKIEKVNTKTSGLHNSGTYPSWHPSARYIAFSVNEIQQFFHSAGPKAIEVSDLAADMVIYDVENKRMVIDSLLYGEQYMETYPNWSPDGKTLFFCRASGYDKKMPLDSIRYDLYKISFDASSATFSSLTCLYEASARGKSVSFPRVSPDGNYLMFTMSEYGNFSIWHPESDLYLLNLLTKEIRPIEEVNSDNVDSFHSWSSDGNWFVFSSKRLDGLWARPYISHFDKMQGTASKPFVLPQKNPLFYDTFNKTFNLPEFITSPVTIENDLSSVIMKEPIK